jgi:hypothetical protein
MARKVNYDGATILITGASAGIGAAFARRLAPRAGTLVLVARRRERLETLKTELVAVNPGLKVVVLESDLADPAAAARMADEAEASAGPVDILINNAGMGHYGTYDRTDWAKVDQMLRVNVIAPAQLAHRFFAPMVRRGRGAILNVGSSFAFISFPGFGAYVGTKYFIDGWTESLRADAAGTGVVVSQVCPGPVITEFTEVAGQKHLDPGKSPVHLTADECARWTLARFERGQAVIIPGRIMTVLSNLGRITPRLFWRIVNPFFARAMRRRDNSLYPANQLGYRSSQHEKIPAPSDARGPLASYDLVHEKG